MSDYQHRLLIASNAFAPAFASADCSDPLQFNASSSSSAESVCADSDAESRPHKTDALNKAGSDLANALRSPRRNFSIALHAEFAASTDANATPDCSHTDQTPQVPVNQNGWDVRRTHHQQAVCFIAPYSV